MRRSFAAAFVALMLVPPIGRGDQLALLPRTDAERVVKLLQEQIRQRHGKPYHLVSYCSLCAPEHVEVWEVKDVVAVAVPDTEAFQIYVFGRCTRRSVDAISEGAYQEPVRYQRVPTGRRDWFLRGVDLAYLYAPSGDALFQCVGKMFRLECEVRVEQIKIPQNAPPAP